MSDEFQLAIPKPPDFETMPLEKTAAGHVFTPFFGFTDPAVAQMAVKQGYGGSIYQSFRNRAVKALAAALRLSEGDIFVSQRTVPLVALQVGELGEQLTAPTADEPMPMRPNRASGVIEWRLSTAIPCQTPAERRAKEAREKAAVGSICEAPTQQGVTPTTEEPAVFEAEIAPEYKIRQFRKDETKHSVPTTDTIEA